MSKQSQTVKLLRAEVKRLNSLLRRTDRIAFVAVEALAFYADPENYHAIAFIPDRPTGAFMEDFSKVDHPHYDRKMPGKEARKAINKINKIIEK